MYWRIFILVITVFNLAIPTQPQTSPPTLRVWSAMSLVNESDLLQHTARIPLSWSVENRPDNTTLVFEQVLGARDPVNVELPRDNPWVASAGDGVVAPVYPDDPTLVQIQVRLVDLANDATLITARLSFDVVRDISWQVPDPYVCFQPPYAHSAAIEIGIYGLVRMDVSGGRLEVWDVPAPVHQVVGNLDPGERFVVLDGPYCYPYPWPGDGTPYLRLWYVRSTGRALEGWVEAYGIGIPDGLAYTIEPYPHGELFFHHYAPEYCGEAQGFLPEIGLATGARARVTAQAPALGLPVGDEPAWYAGKDRGPHYLQPGEIVTILEGPYCFSALYHTTTQASFRLWRVRAERQGIEGWTAEYWEYLLSGGSGYYLEPTPEAVLEPADNGIAGVRVLSFSATPNPVERGGTITLSWHVTGTDTVGITRLSERGGIYLESIGGIMPAQGTLTYTIPDRYVEQIPFVLLLPDVGLLETLTVEIICPFPNTLSAACPLTRQSIDAAFQPFDNGYMVWRGDTRQIYVLFNNGQFEDYPDTWVEGQPDPVADIPPAGRMAPQRGFGTVWNNHPQVRGQLGWALGPEVAYTMTLEVFPGVWNRPDTQVFTLPDGRLVREYMHFWEFGDTP